MPTLQTELLYDGAVASPITSAAETGLRFVDLDDLDLSPAERAEVDGRLEAAGTQACTDWADQLAVTV